MVFLLKKEFALCFGGWVLGLIKFLSPVCLITCPYDRFSFPGDAFHLHGNDGLLAVVEEAYGGFPFLVELYIRHPKQRAPVVFGARQGLAAVIRAVEVFADGIASQDVMPVAVSPLILVVGEEAVVDDDFGLIVLCILPTALFARGIICVDIDFVKVTE